MARSKNLLNRYIYLIILLTFLGCKKDNVNEKDNHQSIVYLRQLSGTQYNLGIYTNNIAGTDEKLILDVVGIKDYPLWSKNDRVFFLSNYQGETHLQIYSVNLDGSNLQRISNCHTCEYSNLRISSRTNRVLYFKSNNDFNSKVLVTSKLDGSDEREILVPFSREVVEVNWFPDGNRIIYISEYSPTVGYTNALNFYTMNIDGSDVTNITNNSSSTEIYKSPYISPDGTKIVYTRANYNLTDGEGYRVGIYTSDIDGSNEQLVTSSMDIDKNGNWSNDGKYILVFGSRFPHSVITPDGKTSKNINKKNMMRPSFKEFLF